MTQETGSPCIWPRSLELPGTLCPSALEMPAWGCSELAFPNPVWKTLFI